MKKIPKNGSNKIWTASLEPLVVEGLNTQRNIAVTVSSIEQENERLLHLLLKKTEKPAFHS